MKKARIFIGSSKEGLDAAYAIQTNLDRNAEITVWDQDFFKLSRIALIGLIGSLDTFDYAIFVFSPDDEIRIRDKNLLTARDNVVFEIGLFMGKLGEKKVFCVKPRDIENLHFPTDLLGFNFGDYESKRSDGNLESALAPFCNKVRKLVGNEFVSSVTPRKASDIFSGIWRNTFKYMDDADRLASGFEIFSVDSNNNYIIDEVKYFTIENFEFNQLDNSVNFLKKCIPETMQGRSDGLLNKLTLIENDILIGTENENIQIKYEKIE